MKSDINEITPDIDINNNSPLQMESGSQWILDEEKSRSKERPGSKLSNRRSKQI